MNYGSHYGSYTHTYNAYDQGCDFNQSQSLAWMGLYLQEMSRRQELEEKLRQADAEAARNDPYYETKKTEELFNGQVPERDQPPTLSEFDLPEDHAEIAAAEKRMTTAVDVVFATLGVLLLIVFFRLFTLRGLSSLWWFAGFCIFAVVAVALYFAVAKLARGQGVAGRYKEYLNAQRAYEYWRDLKAIDHWDALAGEQFVLELTELFRKSGYEAEPGEDGIDIVFETEQERIAVQCRENSKPVNPAAMRDLCDAIRKGDYTRGIMVSKSGFTPGLYKAVEDRPIALLTLRDVAKMSMRSVNEPTDS